MATQVIVDTDPGADDSLAILMLIASAPRTNVVALTTVTGNADIDSVTENAIRTLEVANRTDIPVFKGASQGLIHEVKHKFFFGCDGFGEAAFDTPLPQNVLQDEVAANFLVRRVQEMPNQLTILALGPLTNIAIAIALCPNFLSLVKQLIVFGGSYQCIGNAKPGAEFNFMADPESAQLVLSKAPVHKPVVLVALETVRNVAFPMSWRVNTLGKLNSKFVSFLNKIEQISLTRRDTWIPYDPTAASVLIEPNIVTETKMVSVNVLYAPDVARGVMITDYNSECRNILLVTAVNKGLLETLLLQCLA